MPLYAIGYMAGEQPFTEYERRDCGRAAADCLKDAQQRFAHFLDHRWTIKRLRDDGLPEDWREREQERFRLGTYIRVPWTGHVEDKHPDHFVHMSVEQPGKIAYTQDAAKGEADRQTIIAPGRYLKRFYADVMDANAIERWAAEVSCKAGEFILKITQDADEIEAVYTNGPESCMSGDADNFSGPCHPARVYAGPDLGLAYLGDMNDATGRAVVWPEKKLYGRLYGDTSRLSLLLTAAGYTSGSLNGARVRRIPCDDGFVMPYVDYISYADDDGEFITLGDGDLCTANTCGTTEAADRATCDRCGDSYDNENGGYYLESIEESWCDSCGNHHSTYCEVSEMTWPSCDSTMVEVHALGRRGRWDGGNYISERVSGETLTAREETLVDREDEYILVEETGDWWARNAYEFAKAIEAIALWTVNPELPLAA